MRGNATYRGNPLTNGVVTFFPVNGRPISAVFSQAGEYTVDLAPGDYQVTVMAGNDPVPPGFKEGDPLPQPKLVLPQQYSSRASSPLSASVAADQSEPINFDLK